MGPKIPGMSRRGFVSGLLATVAWPAWARSLPSNPDVIVVGAGSAGLAAANRLIAAGKSVVVLEGADRVGGRAWTETDTFGLPFDRGCSWIQGRRSHPYLKMGRDWGYDLLNHSHAGDAFFVGDKRGSSSQTRKYLEAYDEVERLIRGAGFNGKDVPASGVIPDDLDYAGIAKTWIGAMDYGVDFRNLSSLDYARYGPIGSDYLVREGYGTLVARFGAGLPVRLGTPVNRIDWSGDGVAVDTPAGTLRAPACVVTVSTGVLNAGKIQFVPALPEWKQAAIHNLPMALLAKIPLQFDGERFGLRANQWLTYWVPEKMPAEACFFLTWPFDFDMMIGWIGGEFGWALAAEGRDAAVDFALGELAKIFGNAVRRHFVKGDLTRWDRNPWTLGAYAAARPGHYRARQDIQHPVGDRLFFAGEATAAPYYQLCAGAYDSGVRAADEVLAQLG